MVLEDSQFTLGRKMYNLQQSHFMCDSVIITQESHIPVHKIVLVARSHYFKQLVDSCHSQEFKIVLECETHENVVILVRFLYTGELDLTPDNVQSLRQLSQTLGIEDINLLCDKFDKEAKSDHTKSLHINKSLALKTMNRNNDNKDLTSTIESSDLSKALVLNQLKDLQISLNNNEYVQESMKNCNIGEINNGKIDSTVSSYEVINTAINEDVLPENIGLSNTDSTQEDLGINIHVIDKLISSDENDVNFFDETVDVINKMQLEISNSCQENVDHLNTRKTVVPVTNKTEGTIPTSCDTLLDSSMIQKFCKDRHLKDIQHENGQEGDNHVISITIEKRPKKDRENKEIHVLDFLCDKCGNSYESAEKLKKHNNNTHKYSSYVCSECGKILSTPYTLKRHIEAVHENDSNRFRLLCHLCPKKYTENRKLKSHLLKHHGVMPSGKTKIYECDKCDYVSCLKGPFDRHYRNHKKSNVWYACEFCNKRFPDETDRNRHQLRHTTEPTKCPIEGCYFSAIDKRNVKNHVFNMHTNKDSRRFQCHLCSHACKLRENLIKHLRNKHKEQVLSVPQRRKIAIETGKGYPIVPDPTL